MKIIKVKLKKNPYSIYIAKGLFKKIPKRIKDLDIGNFGIVITTPRILRLYKDLIKKTFSRKNHKVITVIDGELAKSKKYLFNVIDELVKAERLGRKIYVICLGGGSVGDLGGFAASIYKRGIPYVQIPTTLLAQVDSSIGGKTAIDLPIAKNILGSFYQPKAVFIDPTFLTTLPKKELKQGLAEVIKYGIIRDKSFFSFLKSNHKQILKLETASILKVISVSAKIKANIVEEDETEKKGIRTILNFGHTFAHALESSLKYTRLSHGEAVSIGMRFAAMLSCALNSCDDAIVGEIVRTLELFSLPTTTRFDCLTLYKSLLYDKKFTSGKIRMVLLRQIGKVEVVEGLNTGKIQKILTYFNTA